MLPYKTHSRYLPHIVNDLPIEVQLHKRLLKFIATGLNSKNYALHLCSKLVIQGSNSTVCRSINDIWCKYNVREDKLDVNNYIKVFQRISNTYKNCKYQDAACISHIRDLIQMRKLKNCIFKRSELEVFLEYFCVN